MSPGTDSPARARAAALSPDARAIEGPLHGYHHETYVVPLPSSGAGDVPPGVRWKCREPRPGLLWFDRRCFASEEELLRALKGRIASVPEVIEVLGTRLQRFVEGRTLGELCPAGQPVPPVLLRQIVELFRQLAGVAPKDLPVERTCTPEDRAADGDTETFLMRLVDFAETRVYQHNQERFGKLFQDLGVRVEAFDHLREHVRGLRPRPFCLLHADLHRENFVVDAERRLWTIDWELAMFGDPLYDLATHLYLMRYPPRQEAWLKEQWCAAVESARPGGSHGWRRDLERLLDFKRAQSVFTDVIRVALSLVPGDGLAPGNGLVPDDGFAPGDGFVPGGGREREAGPAESGRRCAHAGRKLQAILRAAAGPLGLTDVPDSERIAEALAHWCRAHGDAERAPREAGAAAVRPA
jgi:aminoglycoside phosphotransferase (APT) family kinase protein